MSTPSPTRLGASLASAHHTRSIWKQYSARQYGRTQPWRSTHSPSASTLGTVTPDARKNLASCWWWTQTHTRPYTSRTFDLGWPWPGAHGPSRDTYSIREDFRTSRLGLTAPSHSAEQSHHEFARGVVFDQRDCRHQSQFAAHAACARPSTRVFLTLL